MFSPVQDTIGIINEEDEFSSHSSSSSSSPAGNDEAKLSFLLRYEEFVRRQDAETVAAVGYLWPLFNRLRRIGGDEGPEKFEVQPDIVACEELKVVSDDVRGKLCVDKLNVLSFGAMRRSLSIIERGGGISSTCDYESLLSDGQLMIVLRELTASMGDAVNEGTGLSFPEFLQCYRAVVGGIQTLEMFPATQADECATLTEDKMASDVGKKSGADEAGTKDDQRIVAIRQVTNERVREMVGIFAGKKKSPMCSSCVGNGDTSDKLCIGGRSGPTSECMNHTTQHAGKLPLDLNFDRLSLTIQIKSLQTSRRKWTIAAVAAVAASISFLLILALSTDVAAAWSMPQVYFRCGSEEDCPCSGVTESGGEWNASLTEETFWSEKEVESWRKRRTSEVRLRGEAVDALLTDLVQYSMVSEGNRTRNGNCFWLDGLRVFLPDVVGVVIQMDSIISFYMRRMEELKNENSRIVHESVHALSKLAKSREDNKFKERKIKTLNSDLQCCQEELTEVTIDLDSVRQSERFSLTSIQERDSALARCRLKVDSLVDEINEIRRSDRFYMEMYESCLLAQNVTAATTGSTGTGEPCAVVEMEKPYPLSVFNDTTDNGEREQKVMERLRKREDALMGSMFVMAASERRINELQKGIDQLIDFSTSGLKAMKSRAAQLYDESKQCDIAVKNSDMALSRCLADLNETEMELDLVRQSELFNDAMTSELRSCCRRTLFQEKEDKTKLKIEVGERTTAEGGLHDNNMLIAYRRGYKRRVITNTLSKRKDLLIAAVFAALIATFFPTLSIVFGNLMKRLGALVAQFLISSVQGSVPNQGVRGNILLSN